VKKTSKSKARKPKARKPKDKTPKEIKDKYPRSSTMTFPDKSVENLDVLEGFFVGDHNKDREYWKGFEVVRWSGGCKELRACYWTRKRGTEKWVWGQFSLILSLDKLRTLMEEAEAWFKNHDC